MPLASGDWRREEPSQRKKMTSEWRREEPRQRKKMRDMERRRQYSGGWESGLRSSPHGVEAPPTEPLPKPPLPRERSRR